MVKILSSQMIYAGGSLVDVPFTRPNLTANGTMGGNAFAVSASSVNASYPAFQAVDGSTTQFRPSGSSTNFYIYNPDPLKVTQFKLTFNSANYLGTVSAVYGSNDNSNWTQIAISSSTSSNVTTVNLTNNNYYKYYRIYFTSASSMRLREIDITATYNGKGGKTFTRPNLTANGTMGGNAFAVSASSVNASYPAYYAVDSSTSTYFRPAASTAYYYIYNPSALKVTKFVLTFASSNYIGSLNGLHVSNDNSSYTSIANDTSVSTSSNVITITSNHNSYYKYYRFYFTNGTNLRLTELDITAEIQ